MLMQGIAFAGVLPLAAFCLASSATYIFNDISDRECDRLHPVKKYRPIPAGEISVTLALLFAAVFLFASLLLAWSVSVKFLFYLVGYLLVAMAYSFSLKSFPVIDLFCISSGFLLRLFAGGEAFQVMVSEWLFLSVFLLSIFLSTGKRCSEKRTLGDCAGAHRKALSSYPSGFLEGVLYMTGSAVLVTYTMYVVSRHKAILLFTVPLCCFGLLRYILRIQSGNSGDPTESLTKDPAILLVGICWAVMIGWGIYG